MTIAVRLFAGIRQRMGTSEVRVDIPAGATIGDVAAAMIKQYPGIERVLNQAAWAVNQEYAKMDRTIGAGDEVAVIPPVSGG